MKVAAVGDISEQVRGVTYAKSDASDVPLNGYSPILRANNIGEHGLVLDDFVFVPDTKISPKQRIAPNDILVAASSGSLSVVGKTAQAREGFEGGFGAFCKVLRPGPDVDPHYFGHYFRTPDYRHVVSRLAAGVNINNLKNEHLDNLPIPLPPLAEQKRIAQILDAADALRAKRRESLAQLDTLLQSTFLDMFGDPVTNPMGWEDTGLGDIASNVTDGKHGDCRPDHGSGYFFVSVKDIKDGEIDYTNAREIRIEDFEEVHRRTQLEPLDVLITNTGTIGRTAVIREHANVAKTTFQKSVAIVKPKKDLVDSFYLKCALDFNVGHLSRTSTGSSQKNLLLGQLRSFQVPLPPLDLQHRFTVIVESVEQQKVSQRAHLAELNTLFASLQSRAF